MNALQVASTTWKPVPRGAEKIDTIDIENSSELLDVYVLLDGSLILGRNGVVSAFTRGDDEYGEMYK